MSSTSLAATTESKAAIASQKIGIIGSGKVGQYLAAGLAAKGYQVTVGSRTPSSDALVKWQKEQTSTIKLADLAGASSFGDVIFIATNWLGIREILSAAVPANFVGKTVIDVTNPLDSEYKVIPGPLVIGGELIQSLLPGAFVVKALNSVAFRDMIDPDYSGRLPIAFIAGNSTDGKAIATRILISMGWRDQVMDIGGIAESQLLESLCVLWMKVFYVTHTAGHSFALLRK